MALSDKEKTELIKDILIKRIKSVGSLSALKTLMKNLTWPKIKIFLSASLQTKADQLAIDSQEWLDKKADILALKEEKDDY